MRRLAARLRPRCDGGKFVTVGLMLAGKGEPLSDEAQDIRQEMLPCELTEPELRARGDEIAKLVGDQEIVELEKKEAAESHNAEIKSLVGAQSTLAKQVRERREYRMVDVRRIAVENLKLIRWVRADTDETVRERPMTEEEKQIHLFPAAPDEAKVSGTES